MARLLTPELIAKHLEEFVRRIAAIGIDGNVFIIGGAAMSLAYLENRRATVDIDALFPSDLRVREIINEISEREDFDPKWINNDAKLFIPFDHFGQWNLLYKIHEVSVWVSKPEMLLAMKISADRGVRDRLDIEVLLSLCKIENFEDVEEIYERFRHQEVIKQKTKDFILKWISENC